MSTLSRITYVDDEADLRAVVQTVLGKVGGFEVQACASGSEALEKAGSFAPDLILLDVMMPGMDGTETFRRLRRDPGLGDTPVVFVTAKAQNDEIKAFRAIGAAGVVVKPFKTLELPNQLRSIWKSLHQESVQ